MATLIAKTGCSTNHNNNHPSQNGMKLLQPSTASAFVSSLRGVGDLFIGANVQLRKELTTQQLSGVKVAVLHGKGDRALLVSKILQDHGASLEHFSVKGEKRPTLEKVRELEKSDQDKTYLQNVLRKADVFVDGAGCEQFGLKAVELAKKNAQLIVAAVDAKEPFAAMNAMKAISVGLYLREKQNAGQVVSAADSKTYEESLSKYAQQIS